MADKEVINKLAAPLLPPVAVEKKHEEDPLVPAVQLTSLWALLNAAIMGASLAFAYALIQRHIDPLSWMLPRDGSLTDADVAMLSAIIDGWVWCGAAQAAAAALALLLPAGRCRRALAYAALAATATGHLMMARVAVLFLTADPGCSVWITAAVDFYVFARGDLYCLMALLGRGEYANVPAC